MKKFLMFAALSLVILSGCARSYGDLGMPFATSTPAASSVQAAPQEANKAPGDFTIAEAPPLEAVPNDPVQIAPIAGSEACELPSGLVGKDKSVLETIRFKGPVRIIGPDMPVTMDYSPGRLNIIYDKTGKITEVKCG